MADKTEPNSFRATPSQKAAWEAYRKLGGFPSLTQAMQHILETYVKDVVARGKIDVKYMPSSKPGKKVAAKKTSKKVGRKKTKVKKKKTKKKKTKKKKAGKKVGRKKNNPAPASAPKESCSPPPAPRAPTEDSPSETKKGGGSRGTRRTKAQITQEELDQFVAKNQAYYKVMEEYYKDSLIVYQNPERVDNAVRRTALKVDKESWPGLVEVLDRWSIYPRGIIERAITEWEAAGCPTRKYEEEISDRAQILDEERRGVR